MLRLPSARGKEGADMDTVPVPRVVRRVTWLIVRLLASPVPTFVNNKFTVNVLPAFDCPVIRAVTLGRPTAKVVTVAVLLLLTGSKTVLVALTVFVSVPATL